MTINYISLHDHLDGFMLKNLLTHEECEHYINFSEKKGYEAATMGKKIISNMRNNDMIVTHNTAIANMLFTRAADYFLKPNGLFATRCNERIKFYRYHEGHYFRRHRDKGFTTENNEESLYSFLVYLNDNFEGGETKFMRTIVTPKAGDALIFRHHHRHESNKLRSGTKYVLRTDIMYPTPNNET